ILGSLSLADSRSAKVSRRLSLSLATSPETFCFASLYLASSRSVTALAASRL
ncbi:hypothetical protein A2U01_0118092, partial [Trifolium medium]|nr:hypothetical protein [Trifolium medium]